MADLAGAWALADAIESMRPEVPSHEDAATVTRVDPDGSVWVRLLGSDVDTPVNGAVTASVAKGQRVLVRIEDGRLSVLGNPSEPSVGATYVERAVAPVERRAADAAAAADRAEAEAERARAGAETAWQWADEAHGAAGRAGVAASDALAQLSVVEDVAGTLAWVSEHGTFTLTTDTEPVEGTVYFELDDGEYVPVAEPSGSPLDHGWYVLDVTDSQSEYIMSHLAVTAAGLWVLPSGIGQAQSAQQAPGYKLLLASTGAYLYDASGHLVTTYAESIAFDSSRPQHIGGEDAYILYYDADGDGVPDSIYIGGSRVTIGGRPLSSLLADVAQASSDAASAVQAAADVPIVTLSSTNGTVFKRNLGVSTTIVATIFTPGGRIDDVNELHRRFGAGAYLEWGWRDVVTDADHVLTVSDPRISHGGFRLTVTPEDIDTQAVITCSLNY